LPNSNILLKFAKNDISMKEYPLVNQPAFTNNKSFSIMERPCADLVFPYHMHPDYQLNFVIEGKGIRVTGDHSEKYSSGDLVLLGPNLPHYWTYDSDSHSKTGGGKAVIIHFNRYFAGHDFINKSEVKPINDLLDGAYRGLSFYGELKNRIIKLLLTIKDAQPLNQLVGMINILTEIALTTEYKYLAGPAYENKKIPEQELKIKRIIHFIKMHFNDSDLSLEKCANMASMSPTAFSKYFKKQTGQNYITVLNELRLSETCRLISNSDKTIKQIAQGCGFNNMSNFNKLFRKHYKCTPREFLERINKKKL